MLLTLGHGVGEAGTITVTTTNPAINDGDGLCSLIEAIVNANDGAATHPDCPAAGGFGDDTIVLPTKVAITLTAYDNFTYGPTALPAITSKATIEGNGSKITRKSSAAPFRLFAVTDTGDLTLNNVTLSGGKTQTGGGAVLNLGTLKIRNSTISRNEGGSGGGIGNAGTVQIDNSTIAKNMANSRGGGVDTQGKLTVQNSTITGNKVLYFDGGGIFSFYSSVTVQNSTISDNKAKGDHGGGFGGGISTAYSTLDIDSSTVSKNTARVAGGGLVNASATTLKNSTISGNRVTNPFGFGGGIAHLSPPSTGMSLTVENSTITGNKAGGTQSYGGGIDSDGSGTSVILIRSLISGNKAAVGPEVYNDSAGGASVTADNYNLFGAKGSAGIIGFAKGGTDIVPSVVVASILGSLKDNGGPTKTHALNEGSPAVDAVLSCTPACATIDQRGEPRPARATVDIGAFELQ